MKSKNLLVMCITVFSVLALVGTAFATPGLVDIRTTVPNIARSVCDQAGSISLAIPDQTVMRVGDVVQFTLDTGVTICKNIDFYIMLGNNILFTPANAAGDAVTVSAAADRLILAPDATFGAGDDYGFVVRGNDGSQIFTLQLVRRDGATGQLDPSGNWTFTFDASLGDPANDELTVRLFDEKTIATSPVPILEDDDDDNAYNDVIEESDNVLCIDTLSGDFLGEQVQAFPDSLPRQNDTKLTFTGVYTIANILPAAIFTISNPCKFACPQIGIEATFDQFDNPTSGITDFDPGNYLTGCVGSRLVSENTCATDEGILVQVAKSEPYSIGVRLYISLELRLNGSNSAARGVVSWASPTVEPPVVRFAEEDNPNICTCVGAAIPVYSGLSWSSGSTSTELSMDVTTAIIANGTADAILIDLPQVFLDDLDELDEGDQITVNVTLAKGNCGQLTDGEVCIANVLEQCPTPGMVLGCTRLTFAYATGIEDPDFWGGLAVTNMSMSDGSYDLTFYDVDGNMGALDDQEVVANGLDVLLLADLLDRAGFDAGAADLEAQMWLMIDTDFTADGALFLGDLALNILQGYSPRQSVIPCP